MKASNDKPKDSGISTPIKLGYGPFSIEIPGALFGIIRKNLALCMIGLVAILNLYFTYLNQHGRALIIPGGENSVEIPFSKTFVFWTPDFSQNKCKPDNAVEGEKIFNARLAQKFGGWTRWRVLGSGPEGQVEEGWFYQVSLAKSATPVPLVDIEALVKECFYQRTYYVIETDHR